MHENAEINFLACSIMLIVEDKQIDCTVQRTLYVQAEIVNALKTDYINEDIIHRKQSPFKK